MIRQLGVLRLVLLKLCFLDLAIGFPTLAYSRLKMLEHFFRHQKFRLFGPSIIFLCQADFFFTERLTMRAMRVLFVRRTKSNMTINNNQRRPGIFGLEGAECLREFL